MPATLGDHRGVIKAAVTVVNRAANKGREVTAAEGRKRGREGRDGCRRGRFNRGDCLSLCLLFFFFFFKEYVLVVEFLHPQGGAVARSAKPQQSRQFRW